MGYVVFLSILFITVTTYLKEKKVESPIFVFGLLWTTVTLLAALRLYGLNDVSLKSWLIILIGTLSFFLGVMLSRRFCVRQIVMKNVQDKEYYIFSKKTYNILFALVVLLLFGQALTSLKYFMSGTSLAQIRSAYYGLSALDGFQQKDTGSLSIYLNYIQGAVSRVLVAIGAVSFVENRRKLDLFKSILLVFMSVIIAGGRYDILFLLIDLFVATQWVKKQKTDYKPISFRMKRRIEIILILGFIAIIVVTILRGSTVNEVVKMFYTYICGNVALLDIHIGELDQIGAYSSGIAGLYGIVYFIYPILHFIGIPYSPKYLVTTTYVMTGQQWLQIGEDMYSNAMLTSYYYLYADFRYFGIVVGMLIMGYIIGKLHTKSFYRNDRCLIIYYMIACQCILTTIQTFATGSVDIALILLFMIFTNVKIRR